MKKGTGDDPFADDEPEDSEEEQPIDADGEADDDEFTLSDADTASTSTTASPSTSPSMSTETETETTTLPYYQRRSSVKEDRDDVLQFFVREETAQGEDDLERAVAADLDIRPKELYKLDLREAALLVAMEHPEEVAEKLRDWGYEHV